MFQFNTIEEALDDLRQGKIILVTDDEDRENEGDFICAAEFATTENVNFMAVHGKGLICMPMSIELCQKLNLPQMVDASTDNHETAFTVSIDHINTTTGISAEERGITARACVSEDVKPEDFRRPGHMFPLMAKRNGVLERNGHTEATIDLLRLANLKECGLCCEIMREDGTMMRTPELIGLAQKWNLKFITIKDLQSYRKNSCRHCNKKWKKRKYSAGQHVDNLISIRCIGDDSQCNKTADQTFNHTRPCYGRYDGSEYTGHHIHKPGNKVFFLIFFSFYRCLTIV